MRCPACAVDLVAGNAGGALSFRCATCEGTAVTVPVLRRLAPGDRVWTLWNEVWQDAEPAMRRCPACEAPMACVTVDEGAAGLEIDACRTCQVIWFDLGELRAFAPADSAPRSSGDERAAKPVEARAVAVRERAIDRRVPRVRDPGALDSCRAALSDLLTGIFG